MRTKFAIIAFFILPYLLRCQNALKNWHFGNNGLAIHFDNGTPNLDFSTIVPFSTAGSAVFNNPTTGELIFYTDGLRVIDKNHALMPNGSGLFGGSSTHGSGKIVPNPNNCNELFVFSISTATENQFSGNLYYSMVDLSLPGNGSLSNPLGDVINSEKNILLAEDVGEALEVIPHENGIDYWLISPLLSSPMFQVFLITNNTITQTGTYNYGTLLSDLQPLRFCPSNNKIAFGSLRENDPVRFANFDPLTGELSNFSNVTGSPFGLSTNPYAGIIDVEWSPDGSKLYISKLRGNNPSTGGALYQYDLNTPLTSASLIQSVSSSPSNVSKGLRLGPDGIIYWLTYDQGSSGYSHIAGILDPNSPGTSCNLNMQLIDAGIELNATALFPNFVPIENDPPTLSIDESYIFPNCTYNSDNLELSSWFTDAQDNNILLIAATSPDILLEANDNNISLIGLSSNSTYNIEIIVADDHCFPAYDTVNIQLVTQNIITGAPPEIFQEDQVNCAGQEAIIGDMQFDLDISWSNGMSGPTITVAESGIYIGEFTWTDGCVYSDSIVVEFNDPLPVVSNTISEICEGESAELACLIDNAVYNWSTGETTQNIVVSNGGQYYVTAMVDEQCLHSAQIQVNLTSPPEILSNPANLSILLCDQETAFLNPSCTPGAVIYWTDGSADFPRNVFQSGTYTAIAENSCGSSSLTYTIETLDTPYFDLGSDFEICEGLDTTIAPNVSLDEYVWSDGSTGSALDITEAGIYWLSSSNACGTFTDEINVSYIAQDIPTLSAESVLCIEDETWLISPFTGNGTLNWSTSENAEMINVSAGGEFWLEIITACGTGQSSITVEPYACIEEIYAPNSFTPDNDGINDIWQVVHPGIERIHLRIYNRWGELIFENSKGESYWTGNVRSGSYYAPDGVYIFEITDLDDPLNPHSLRGTITLIR
jgi:gliding motility-associated-like protein